MQPEGGGNPLIQDSVVGGNLHTGDVTHHHYHTNPQQIQPPQQQVVMMNLQKPRQNGLITASYLCSGIGLLIQGGFILGPIGFILGRTARKNGDKRGKRAMIFGGVVTIISYLLVVLFGWELFRT